MLKHIAGCYVPRQHSICVAVEDTDFVTSRTCSREKILLLAMPDRSKQMCYSVLFLIMMPISAAYEFLLSNIVRFVVLWGGEGFVCM